MPVPVSRTMKWRVTAGAGSSDKGVERREIAGATLHAAVERPGDAAGKAGQGDGADPERDGRGAGSAGPDDPRPGGGYGCVDSIEKVDQAAQQRSVARLRSEEHTSE